LTNLPFPPTDDADFYRLFADPGHEPGDVYAQLGKGPEGSAVCGEAGGVGAGIAEREDTVSHREMCMVHVIAIWMMASNAVPAVGRRCARAGLGPTIADGKVFVATFANRVDV
jgi:hypothetical protein